MVQRKAAQRQAFITVAGVEGTFATHSGGDTTATVSREYDGGSLTPELMSSPAETADITVGRAFEPTRDRPIIKRLRSQVGRMRTTVTVQDTDENLVRVGSPDVYADALLIGVTPTESDANSGDAKRFELTWAVTSVA